MEEFKQDMERLFEAISIEFAMKYQLDRGECSELAKKVLHTDNDYDENLMLREKIRIMERNIEILISHLFRYKE